MASPAMAVPTQVNSDNSAGPISRSHSPVSTTSLSKRKRDDGDDGDDGTDATPDADTSLASANDSEMVTSAANVKGTATRARNQRATIQDYLDVLRRYDSEAAILKQPLPDVDETAVEPDAKRHKSENETVSPTALSIEAKVAQDGYSTVEDVLADVTRAARARIAALKSPNAEADAGGKADDLVSKITELRETAQRLYRRELAYPSVQPLLSLEPQGKDTPSQASDERALLMTYATINNGKKPLLTSLQTPPSSLERRGQVPTAISGSGLPSGITVTHAVGENYGSQQTGPSRTLGELFPSPRNLPPLQPPKPNKGTTRSNVLSFYHPVLTDQSSYRTGTYFSQTVSTGQWLDYSNATPATHKKTKQRERAQSLAGVKPSTTELEMSEMEALFRGAFSSFAPCKDDSGAVVPSGQVSRMYWQRYGRRNLQRVMDSELPGDGPAPSDTLTIEAPLTNDLPEVDEDVIKEVIDSWDDAAIDPSLSDVMGQKSEEEKEVEDVLQEVSDLIETLASYQRNRNLTMPTSQDRFSTDPPNGDMLRNGTQSHHQPSEEEMLTYQALKAQLSLIIQTLPPFAVARINSDKLEELSVSTKIEIRTDDFKGIMEEDDRAIRSRQVPLQAAAPTPRATPHRTPSMSGSGQYTGNHQYVGQYATHARSPMPAPQHYPQTPGRAQPPNAYSRPTSAVPLPQPHQPQVRHAVVPPQQYRPSNSYGAMTPQMPKPPPPSYSGMGHYSGNVVAGQPRVQQPPQQQQGHQGFPAMPPSASPNHRYQQPYASGYPQQQQSQQSMHPPQHPGVPQQLSQQRPYSPYVNGTGHMPPRNMSPQVGMPPHSYSQSPTPPQQHQQPSRPPYGTPTQPMPPNGRSYNGTTPGMPPQAQGRSGNLGGGATGFATVMGDTQQKHVVDQARQQAQAQHQVQAQQQASARHDAQSRASTFGHEASHGNKVVGLAGIGLSGSMDITRLAATRVGSMGHGNSVSQSPKAVGAQPVRNTTLAGHGLNGGAVLPPPVASSMSPPPGNPSHAVGGNSPAA